jgi:propionyl-CoA carboxylase alpha chain
VFCEPYVETARHVEVQVLGDTHGHVVVLGDRDCSVQRRHQKVVEEAPAPRLEPAVRQALHDAARSAATAIGYIGAGTVEFLLEGDRFFFLEMNTRLQVEHPVTEAVTGLDLVALQLAVAEGRPVDPSPAGPAGGRGAGSVMGHAVEVRLYAEDPARDYQPQSGRLTRLEIPGVAASFENPASYGLRLDSGFGAGDEVGTHYDAMIAKLVSWAPTRTEAVRRLAAALERAQIHGVRTNRDLLVEVLRHDTFVAGQVSTDFLERQDPGALERRTVVDEALRVSAFAAAVTLAARAQSAAAVQPGVPAGWRNVRSQPQRTVFDVDGAEVVAEWHGGRDGFRSADGTLTAHLSAPYAALTVHSADNSVARRVEVYVEGDRVDVESALGHVALTARPRFVDPADQVASGSLLAPMPGSVVRLHVAAGQEVVAGQPVLVLEAMKMQHTVTAPADGTVTDLPVTVGTQVAAGTVLAVVQQADVTATGGEDR